MPGSDASPYHRHVQKWWRQLSPTSRALVAIGLVAVVVQSVGLYGPPGPGTGSALPLDKVAHLFSFAIAVALFVAAGIRWWLVVGLAVVQAVVSEVVQGLYLSQRSGDVLDLAADGAGIVVGLGFGLLIGRRHLREDANN